jgi:YD repeat-containing protein
MKITTNIYNGQPDPFNGNAVASCAPTTALLPDGKPIAVLCKKVEQATTNADGSKGVYATLDSAIPARIWTYAYNQYGQVLTAKSPRTDANDTTSYVYYTDTTADHTLGDLQSVTNSAGHITQYPRYDKAGRVLRSIDPTGAITDITYKPRGWVESVTVTPTGGGTAQVTSYSYDAVGQLKQVTLPDAVTLQYTYDDAHRLTAVTDGAGNTVSYTLDNAGNKTGETLKDASGNLAHNITRVFDALGRVQQTTGAAQ